MRSARANIGNIPGSLANIRPWANARAGPSAAKPTAPPRLARSMSLRSIIGPSPAATSPYGTLRTP